MRPLVLGALLLAVPAHAQSPAGPAAQPYPPEKVRWAHQEIGRSGLDLYKLIDMSNHGMRWTTANLVEFAEMIKPASRAVAALHARHPSATADAYGNGTMTNIEDSFKLFGGGNLERGCISHQQTTFNAVKGLGGKSLSVKKIRYGLPPFQHNAVIVFPAGTDWMYTGVVFDAWLKQKSDPDRMTYLYEKWGPIRPVGGVDVEPRFWKAGVKLLGDDE
jgi:hypothetical protein